MTILSEQLELIRSPQSTIAKLATDPRAVFLGFKHVLVFAVLYEFVTALWAFGGATPTIPAFLKIPDDQYCYYQLIFEIPMIVIVWLLAGSIAYVLSKALGGEGLLRHNSRGIWDRDPCKRLFRRHSRFDSRPALVDRVGTVCRVSGIDQPGAVGRPGVGVHARLQRLLSGVVHINHPLLAESQQTQIRVRGRHFVFRLRSYFHHHHPLRGEGPIA